MHWLKNKVKENSTCWFKMSGKLWQHYFYVAFMVFLICIVIFHCVILSTVVCVCVGGGKGGVIVYPSMFPSIGCVSQHAHGQGMCIPPGGCGCLGCVERGCGVDRRPVITHLMSSNHSTAKNQRK